MTRHNRNVDTCGRIFAKSQLSELAQYLVKRNWKNVDMRPHVSHAGFSVTDGNDGRYL